MRYAELTEKWSNKYKKSINCSNPKGFSQKAHCAGRKKNEAINGVGHHTQLSMPKNTVVIDTPGELDWFKIGQHFPTLSQADPKEFGQSESDMVITFQSEKEKQMFLMLARKLGLTTKDIGGTTHHPEIHKENFADGKVKGKSRPGRVKRSGASCKGSVTDLRAKAKKSSGEKAKMYHWCANMKSGRKK